MIPLPLAIAAVAGPAYFALIDGDEGALRVLWRGDELRTWHRETLAVAITAALAVVAISPDRVGAVWWGGHMLGHAARSIGTRIADAYRRVAGSPSSVGITCERTGQRLALFADVLTACYLGVSGATLGVVGLGLTKLYAKWRGFYSSHRKRDYRRIRRSGSEMAAAE